MYNAPWGLVIATNFSVQSGPYSGPVVTRIAAADPRFGPPTVTLSNGRVVSNPLATTIRFAGKDRGDQQIKAPYLNVVNLRIGRHFLLRHAQARRRLRRVQRRERRTRISSSSTAAISCIARTTPSRTASSSA